MLCRGAKGRAGKGKGKVMAGRRMQWVSRGWEPGEPQKAGEEPCRAGRGEKGDRREPWLHSSPFPCSRRLRRVAGCGQNGACPCSQAAMPDSSSFSVCSPALSSLGPALVAPGGS